MNENMQFIFVYRYFVLILIGYQNRIIMIKAKWLICTVVIGLIPIILKVLIITISKSCHYTQAINTADFTTFSLILGLSNVNELSEKDFSGHWPEWNRWKTINIWCSGLFIVLSSVFLAIGIYHDFHINSDINIDALNILAIIAMGGSFAYSYSLFNRLNKINLKK